MGRLKDCCDRHLPKLMQEVPPSDYLIRNRPELPLPVMTMAPSMLAQPREATSCDQHSRSITCGPDEQRHRSRGRGIWPFPTNTEPRRAAAAV